MPQLEKHYIETNKIQYFAKQFPLSFQRRAKGAAVAASCAEKLKKGSYWYYHKGLFTGKIGFDESSYVNAAVQLQLNQKKYEQCLAGADVAALVDADIAHGSSAGVSGTPAFLIGRIENNTLVDARLISGARLYEAFVKTIDSLL